MGRKSKKEYPSTGSMLASFAGVAVFIAIAVGVVILKAKRRAANDPNRISRTDDSGGGGFTPNPQPFNPNPQPQPNPNPPNPQPQPEPKQQPGIRQTNPEGGGFASVEYREYREDGALLVGFEIGLGKAGATDIVTYLRPIWLTKNGETFGTAYGNTQKPVITVKARDGYAVGGLNIAGGGAMEGIAVTFMKRGPKGLNTADAYVSEWYGEQSRKPRPEDVKRGDGAFVIGIYGKRFENKNGTEFNDNGCIGTLGLYLWVP